MRVSQVVPLSTSAVEAVYTGHSQLNITIIPAPKMSHPDQVPKLAAPDALSLKGLPGCQLCWALLPFLPKIP